jgi:peptide deformylase
MSQAKSNTKWMTGQAHESIVTIGDPLLKTPPQPIHDFEQSRALFDKMVGLLRELNGAGLAAPQIGESWEAIVVEVRKTDVFPDRPQSPLIMMANPRIIETCSEIEDGWEGCFSVPGIMGKVPRHRHIRVQYLSPDGTHCEEDYSGYVARVIQHEVDHLNAIEFVERMETMESLTTVANYLRFHHPSSEKQG